MLSQIIDKIWPWIVHTGLPIVYFYHLLTGNIFLNVADKQATGLEKLGNDALIPFQYLFAGQEASYSEVDHVYHLTQRFDYNDEYFWIKTIGSIILLPPSLAYGSILKGLSYLSLKTQEHHRMIKLSMHAPHIIKSNNQFYRSLGIEASSFLNGDWSNALGYKRHPGDEHKLKAEKEALREIVKILNEDNILFWVDCGTCLGAYRYGGSIPWDNDIDIAILQPDFENVKHSLNRLDPLKYQVQDWSSRDKPNTYLKVYVKEVKALIDIYHCKIDQEKGVISTIVSNENCIFLPESWKIRERRCTTPLPFSTVFPLKKGYFEDIIVPIPNKPKEYLQSKYGENISPAKVYNEKTGQYEKDLSHPYWQLKYAN